ncbi:hypothetical protein DM860_008955 [Cuscuta australis]|uniref:tRNA-uridine aminocarboxypropyltransferase n=1 Tax=Cuscuta australis TaxID=267555 RepID=A0A328DD05_9ASTE|nr:hypothetical protein DM860_008955 [Cuscuta australis]
MRFCTSAPFSTIEAFLFFLPLRPAKARARAKGMETRRLSSASLPLLSPEAHRVSGRGASISPEEWQGWGSTSPVPAMVVEVIEDLKLLERNVDARMDFGGNHGKLQGDFKVHEDKKHRAKYKSLGDSESKLQFFSARQIACRLLGSRDYLCQKCWLAKEDCMCSRVIPYNSWHRIRFWLYMHPKVGSFVCCFSIDHKALNSVLSKNIDPSLQDFLRQNNTGKLLWQVFGVHAANLILFGISENEDMLWDALKLSGKDKVWCLYPNKNAASKSVKDSFYHTFLADPMVDCQPENANSYDVFNFILLDGTWSNSTAMFSRLKERAKSLWGEELPCISLNTGLSLMHRLRPQPSWDRTCTAAAASGLLQELHLLPAFDSYELDKHADAIEDALEVLLDVLTQRRLRMGRPVAREGRHCSNIIPQAPDDSC